MIETTEQDKNMQAEAEKQRVIQETHALIMVAQKMHRNEIQAINRIMQAATRETIAKNAIYAYPSGENLIKGPSIRAAETLAQYWGNIDFGTKEVYRDSRNHISEVMAYAWDLESNTRQVKTFKVYHAKFGNILRDSREIYEKVSNEGARFLRACILGVIPNDIVEDFIVACENTLAGDNSTSLTERVIEIIMRFEEFGVYQTMIEKRFNCEFEQFDKKQLIELCIIYKSIKDNFQSAESFFDTGKKINQSSGVAVKNVFEEKEGNK